MGGGVGGGGLGAGLDAGAGAGAGSDNDAGAGSGAGAGAGAGADLGIGLGAGAEAIRVAGDVGEDAAPHQRLLLALAALSLSPELLARTSSLTADPALDAGAFLDASARHKLLPLVGRHVHRHRLRTLPHPWVLAGAYTANRARNSALADEFGGVQQELAAAEVNYALRKGFAFAEGLYGDPGVRRIGDLDLALDPRHTGRAHTVLTHLGYVQGTLAPDTDRVVPYPETVGADGPVRGGDGEFLPYRKAGLRPEVPEFYIDLCPALPEPPLGLPTLPMEAVLERARPSVRCGSPARELGPADQLIDLWAQLREPAQAALKGKPGPFLPLAKLLDVALLGAASSPADWEETRALTEAHGLWPALETVPRLTGLVFPGSVPAGFTDGAGDNSTRFTGQLAARLVG